MSKTVSVKIRDSVSIRHLIVILYFSNDQIATRSSETNKILSSRKHHPCIINIRGRRLVYVINMGVEMRGITWCMIDENLLDQGHGAFWIVYVSTRYTSIIIGASSRSSPSFWHGAWPTITILFENPLCILPAQILKGHADRRTCVRYRRQTDRHT